MKHILLKCALMGAAVILGSIGAQAAWTYDAEAKTLSNGDYAFKVTLLKDNKAITDPSTNEKVEGFQITGLATAGTGEAVDFTDVKSGTGYDMIAFDEATRLFNTTPCKHVVAPDVLKLGRSTFYQNANITSIVISDKVAAIPYYCFAELPNLETVTPTEFPYVETMNDVFPFRNSTKLTGDFSFPKLTVIGNGAFQATAITGFSAPKLKMFDSSSYAPLQGCSSLTGDLQFAELEHIGANALRGTAITSIVAPAVTNIGLNAFMGCTAITNIQLGAACAKNYGDQAYSGCKNLVKLDPWPSLLNVTNTGSSNLINPLTGCESLVGSIELSGPEGLHTIPGGWMNNCHNITSITIRTTWITNVANWAVQNLAPGAVIYWNTEKAPLSFGYSFYSKDSNNRARIVVKGDVEGWKTATGNRSVSDDTGRADYPGKKTFGKTAAQAYLVEAPKSFCIRIQ